MRKVLICLITILIVFQNFSPVLAAGDTTPPNLVSSSINKKSIKVGDTIVLTFNVDERESGLSQIGGDSIIELQHTSGQRYVTHLYNTTTKNQFITKIFISSNMLKGKWRVTDIAIRDKARNVGRYNEYDPRISGLYFDVINGLEDVSAPVIKSISVLNKTYKPNDRFKVEITAEDQSGLVGIYGILQFKHSQTEAYIMGSLRYNSITKKIEAFVTIPEDVKNGVWELFNININDLYGNEKMYFQQEYPYFKNYRVSITGGSNDFSPPVLKSIILSKNTIFNGESFTAEVDIEDMSPISRVSVSFIHRGTSRSFWSILEWDMYKKKYTTEFTIPLNAPVGEWEIEQVHIADVVNNNSFYFPHTHPELLPSINVLPLFKGTDNLLLKKGSKFDYLLGVIAESPFEGNITSKISLGGEVNTNVNGIYLLKYSVPSKNYNYIYEDYRWITVDDGIQVEEVNGESTVFFDSDVFIGMPENKANLSLSYGKKNLRIVKDTNIKADGEYKLQLNAGASAMRAASKPIKINKSIKFVIDKTPPLPPKVNKITRKTTMISGKTDKKATVNIGIIGRKGITVKANKNGYFSAKIPKLKAGTKIKFTVKDRFGRSSKPTIKVVNK
ncbi:MAG: wprA 1 [Bacillales bacterium]|jgi:hypothetical protein|nr:wprA 1 [Bacillales bacterium]